MTLKLEEGDCRKIMRRMLMVDRQFHSIVTDPPYHLLSIAKRFGKASLDQGGSVMDKVRDRSNPHARHAHGFVGQSWDGADQDGYQIAHDTRLWRMAYDLLLPGGYCLAFTSPMTGHRMAVAMEDAGFRIHGFIGWAYGSGMPKAHAVGEDWPGWFHSTQTLKPALEPVYIAQKPPEVRPMAKNMALHGVGGMNVDACRVTNPENINAMGVNLSRGGESGRWPSTLAHDGSPALQALFPAAKNGDRTADYFNTFPPFIYHGKAAKADRLISNDAKVTVTWDCPNSGPQSTLLMLKAETSLRKDIDVSFLAGDFEWFTFLCGSSISDLCRRGSKYITATKTSSIIESKILSWLTRSLTKESMGDASLLTEHGLNPAESAEYINQSTITIVVKTEFQVGANHVASNSLLTINVEEDVSPHPTVKPIELIQWLMRLVTPPGGTILDPFCGTGTGLIAARREGFNAVGIEQHPEYAAAIRRRILTRNLI